ncbi:MAG: ABC transporter ATP-binding protein [Burkholderiaceae bacterium]|nr:ABC transporter ATP-binding protein [Burkholderiaceae bacterium]
MSRVLDVSRLHKNFGGVRAVADVSLHVDAGEVVALVGPNGAGKSTVINLITGHSLPDLGAVIFKEHDITRLAPHLRAALGLARTFQTPQFFPELTLTQNVAVGAHRLARAGLLQALWLSKKTTASMADIDEQSRQAIAFVGIAGDAQRTAGAVSYGDQKRLELARALVLKPGLLLLDEPAAGLDPSETREIGQTIHKTAKSLGLGVLLVEHDMKLVRAVADRVVVMDQGRIIASGAPDAVLADPQVVEAYLGLSAVSSAPLAAQTEPV